MLITVVNNYAENPSLKNQSTDNTDNMNTQADSEPRVSQEVNPTATSELICKKCGKAFRNQHDLIRHETYEEGEQEKEEGE